MKVKDKFSNDGLFNAISQHGALLYSQLIDIPVMDLLYISNYGERTLSNFGENTSVDNIGKALFQMFGNKWNKLFDMAISNIDIDYNYAEKLTEDINNTGKNTLSMNSTNTDSVNAYNDDDFVSDKQNENVTTNSGENVDVKKREYIKQILKGSKTNYYNEILNYLQNNYFNDIIIRDINEFLTLSIFE